MTGTTELYDRTRKEVLNSQAGQAIKKQYRDQMTQKPVVLTPVDQISLAGTISKYIAPMLPEGALPAELVVTVPEDATLFVDGEPSTQTETVRTFQTPPLPPGKRFAYQLRISLVRGASEWTSTQRAVVRRR